MTGRGAVLAGRILAELQELSSVNTLQEVHRRVVSFGRSSAAR